MADSGKQKVYGEKFTERRIKAEGHRTMLNTSDCDGISGLGTLQSKLNNLTEYMKQHDEKIHPIPEFSLYPFCNEVVKVAAAIDQVNRPTIKIAVLNIFKAIFQITTFTLVREGAKAEVLKAFPEIIESPTPSPERFLDVIINVEKNQFIISHSEFMTGFFDHIVAKYNFTQPNNGIYNKFDNLDIIQLIINNKNIVGIIIRRWKDQYSGNGAGELPSDGTDTKYVFIMRHCVGCHNYETGLANKAGRALGRNNKGYLEFAMCFFYTYDEMLKTRVKLLILMNKYGGYNSYSFGSSVLFRAILTGILLVNAIDSIAKPQSSSITGPSASYSAEVTNRGANNVTVDLINKPGSINVQPPYVATVVPNAGAGGRIEVKLTTQGGKSSIGGKKYRSRKRKSKQKSRSKRKSKQKRKGTRKRRRKKNK
jgi:hypothetical protein